MTVIDEVRDTDEEANVTGRDVRNFTQQEVLGSHLGRVDLCVCHVPMQTPRQSQLTSCVGGDTRGYGCGSPCAVQHRVRLAKGTT